MAIASSAGATAAACSPRWTWRNARLLSALVSATTVVACAQQDDRPLERAARLVGALHPAEQGAQRRQDPGLRFAVVAGELQGALEAHQSVVGAVEVIALHRAKVAQGIDFAGAIAQRGEPSYRGLEQLETGGRIARGGGCDAKDVLGPGDQQRVAGLRGEGVRLAAELDSPRRCPQRWPRAPARSAR